MGEFRPIASIFEEGAQDRDPGRGRRLRVPEPALRRAGARASAPRAGRQGASVGQISAESCSFSAVSAPIFARKYAFCSIFQNLPDS